MFLITIRKTTFFNESGKPGDNKDVKRGRRNARFCLEIPGRERSLGLDPRSLIRYHRERDSVPLEPNQRSGKLLNHRIHDSCQILIVLSSTRPGNIANLQLYLDLVNRNF